MSQAVIPDSGPAPQRPPLLSVNFTVRTMLLVAVIVGLAFASVAIRDAVLTLFLALFSALVLEPVVRLMQRHSRFGRGACATILVLSLTALAVLFGLLLLIPLADSFRDFVQALPGMVDQISNNSSVGSWVNEHSQAPETAQANVKEIAQAIAGAAGGLIGVVVTGFSAVLALVTAIFLTLFLMIDLPRLIGAVDSLLDPVARTAGAGCPSGSSPPSRGRCSATSRSRSSAGRSTGCRRGSSVRRSLS